MNTSRTKKNLALLFLLIISVSVEASLAFSGFRQDLQNSQTSIWQTLFKVTWYKKFNAELKAEIPYPKFNESIKALDGKEITISGFVIPLDMYAGEYVVLSAFPANQCYFCGGAGPESVIEVYTSNQRNTFATQKVTFKGKLELNDSDHSHLIYILRDAKQVYK